MNEPVGGQKQADTASSPLKDALAELTASYTANGGGQQQGPAPRYVGGLVAPPRYQPGSPRQADRQHAYDNQFVPYIEDDLLAPGSQSPEDIALLQEQMRAAGLFPKNSSFRVGRWDAATIDAYERVLAHANANGVPDMIALKQLKESPEMGADGKMRNGEEERFTGKKTQTDRSTRLTDPTSARATVRSILRRELGRAPKADEYAAFVGALNAAEQANPVTQTSTTDYVDGEATGSTSIQAGGMDASAYAEEFARSGELGTEANTFKVEGDFYNAAMDAIRGRGLLDG